MGLTSIGGQSEEHALLDESLWGSVARFLYIIRAKNCER
jgi:hypothetical protein